MLSPDSGAPETRYSKIAMLHTQVNPGAFVFGNSP